MKPAKKKTSKKRNPMISKLLDLKYRINEAYRSYPSDVNKDDKDWVMGQIQKIRDGGNIYKMQMLKANELWNDYNPSRRNNWEDSHSRRDNV